MRSDQLTADRPSISNQLMNACLPDLALCEECASSSGPRWTSQSFRVSSWPCAPTIDSISFHHGRCAVEVDLPMCTTNLGQFTEKLASCLGLGAKCPHQGSSQVAAHSDPSRRGVEQVFEDHGVAPCLCKIRDRSLILPPMLFVGLDR